ncbi:uncharacterized protein [Narcine bancroftii]|uniref:uncharacterized protein n=1 Tax=Narcine bancroftii TaxID=1343680 RepID=UPI0038320483
MPADEVGMLLSGVQTCSCTGRGPTALEEEDCSTSFEFEELGTKAKDVRPQRELEYRRIRGTSEGFQMLDALGRVHMAMMFPMSCTRCQQGFYLKATPRISYASQRVDSVRPLFDWTLKSGWIDGRVRGLIGSCCEEAGHLRQRRLLGVRRVASGANGSKLAEAPEPSTAARSRVGVSCRPVWMQQVRSYPFVASAAAARPNKETSTQVLWMQAILLCTEWNVYKFHQDLVLESLKRRCCVKLRRQSWMPIWRIGWAKQKAQNEGLKK